jgi:Iap family predicted aminopeptidase
MEATSIPESTLESLWTRKAYLLESKHPLKEASDEDILIFCDHIKRVLNMQLDVMFSILRKNHGEVTEDDLVIDKNSAEQAALLWKKLGLSYTPSFHYVHKEALRLLTMHGGFEELVEDHLE